ncbi:ERF family protein [Variovorax sp. AFSI2.2]|uniref:ERF family protein n=1 Tax=Variovorax sp. AFSI2.2 TaxID=3384160 RepID=UPI003EBD5119
MNATTVEESQVLELAPRVEHPTPAARAGGGLVDKSPVGIMMAAINSGATLEQFEKMMELQQRWEANEARKAFVQAMADFKAEPLEIFKRKHVGYTTKDGDFVGYKHAELSHIADVVVPAMARHGLSHRWDLQQTGGRIVVICTITHRLGHAESVSMDGSPDASGKKNSIQQVASTITYLQRYTLLAATGLATKDDADDDGRGGGGSDGADEQKRAGAPPPPAAPTCWPADLFAQRLPEWRAAIAEGRAKADQVINKARTKFPLSDEQIAAIRSPASATGPTYAHVADQLNKAANDDALAVAADLIKDVADPAHRTELNALFDKRRAELNA